MYHFLTLGWQSNRVARSNRRSIKLGLFCLALAMLSSPAFADIELIGVAANPTDFSHLSIGEQFEVDFYASTTDAHEFITSGSADIFWDGSHATLDSWQKLPGIFDDLSTDPLVVTAFFTATALGTGGASLEFNVSTTSGNFDVFSNNVPFTVTPVPELPTIWLLATLLVMTGFATGVRRRVRGDRTQPPASKLRPESLAFSRQSFSLPGKFTASVGSCWERASDH
jgi:hypothetical protein